MSNVKNEVVNALDVIKESLELNCPDDKEKILEVEKTKDYIINNLNEENDKVD